MMTGKSGDNENETIAIEAVNQKKIIDFWKCGTLIKCHKLMYIYCFSFYFYLKFTFKNIQFFQQSHRTLENNTSIRSTFKHFRIVFAVSK